MLVLRNADARVDQPRDHRPGPGRVRICRRAAHTGHQAEQIRDENEQEHRADDREILAPLGADPVLREVRDQLDEHFENVAKRESLVGHEAAIGRGDTPAEQEAAQHQQESGE